MAESIAIALQTDGFWYLLCVMFGSGLVFGFAGFGAALVFVPLASAVVAPVVALALIALTAYGGALTTMPAALRIADTRRLWLTFLPAAVALVPGTWVLRTLPVMPLRWTMCALVTVALIALISGWRQRLPPSRGALVAFGATAGFAGGATGMFGAVVVLFNLSGPDNAAIARANMVCFLSLIGMTAVPVLMAQGAISWPTFWIGVMATPVYMVGTIIGRRLFNPRHERLFRAAGYLAIGGAVLVALPLWD